MTSTLTLQSLSANQEACGVLLQHAQASGADLKAMKRLTITLRARMTVTIDEPLQQCLALMGNLTASMAQPKGRQVLLDPELGTVVDAGEIAVMTIRPAPIK